MASLGSCFVLAKKMPPMRRVLPSGAVCDELLVVASIWPLLQASLHDGSVPGRGGLQRVFCTDAEGNGHAW